METGNAREATEAVRDFLAEMGVDALSSPLRATRRGGRWIVDFAVGYKHMRFLVDATTGKIVQYVTIKD